MTETKTHDCFMTPQSRKELEAILREDPMLFMKYQLMEERWKEHFCDYFAGKKTLPFTYDPFFKRIFNPEIYPERLSRFISSILGEEVKVVKILPQEEVMIDGGALLIMDILVQLADGSLTNIEIQKIPYKFAGERMSCYSSDLLLRQYSKVKANSTSPFDYRSLKKVYTIVIFENSMGAFHKPGMNYIHKGKVIFDTGLKMNMLQEYCLISLDVFRKTKYTKGVEINELNRWLSFLAIDNISEAGTLLDDYPWLEEVYQDVSQHLCNPKEVLGMFSEALKIMDQNTVLYMFEEKDKEIAERDARIAENEAKIAKQATELEQCKQLLEQCMRLLEQAGIDFQQ